MSQKRGRKLQISTDEEKCEVISSAICNMMATSDNVEFLAKCRQIAKAQSEDQVKNNFKKIFMNFATNKKASNEVSSSTSSEEQSDSLDSFLENLENSSAQALKEFDGFDIWED